MVSLPAIGEALKTIRHGVITLGKTGIVTRTTDSSPARCRCNVKASTHYHTTDLLPVPVPVPAI